MITLLNHKQQSTSEAIHTVFQVSYKVEAQFLEVAFNRFPPLNRTINDLKDSSTQFYGFYKEKELAAVIEIDYTQDLLYICSLVVHPNYFRQGIARQLLEFATSTYTSPHIKVETGYKNEPAKALYEKFGFVYQGKYMTNIGVEKAKFSIAR